MDKQKNDDGAIYTGYGHTEDQIKLSINAETVRRITVLLEDSVTSQVFPAIILIDKENNHAVTMFARDASAMLSIAHQMIDAVAALKTREEMQKKADRSHQPSEN